LHAGHSTCPAGGLHDGSKSGHYLLTFGEGGTNTNPQGGWRWCKNCEGLFFDGHLNQNHCPAAVAGTAGQVGGNVFGPHNGQDSGHYVLARGAANIAPIGRIGEIAGTIAWPVAEIRVTGNVADVIHATPGTVTITPSTNPQEQGKTTFTPITEVDVVFGSPLTVGSRVTVPYRIGRLPLNIPIEVDVKAINSATSGTFNADNSSARGGTCTFDQPTVLQVNFHFVPF
jgi:hypothetical protein